MKVLVAGATGMAGHVIANHLKGSFDVVTHNGRKQFDVMDQAKLDDFIDKQKPDVIVNAVGVLNVDANEDHGRTVYLNSYLPHYLSTKARVIHISTDCVFSGLNAPYYEYSMPDATDLYGRSKALGELKNDKDLTFRMSIVGPELKDGSGLFSWFMGQEEVSGFKNVIWTGVTTFELARAIGKAIKQNLTGLYHLVPNESISKYELLTLFAKKFTKEVVIKPSWDIFNDKTLKNTRIDFYEYCVPGYEEMIGWMNSKMVDKPNLYSRYL